MSGAGLQWSWRLAEVVLRALREQGHDPARALADVGLQPVEDPSESEARIAREQGLMLLQWGLAKTGDPRFGLRVAEAYQPGAHLFEYLAVNSPTLEVLLERICRYFRLLFDEVRPSLERGEPHCAWVVRFAAGQVAPPALADLILGVAVIAGRRWTGLPSAGLRVEFAYPEPRDTRAYQDVLQTEVAFDAPDHRLVFPAAGLQVQLPAADPALSRLLEQHAEALLDRRPQADDLVGRVRAYVGDALSAGDATLERAARHLGVSPRTLRRRLSDAGTSHRELVESVRQERATVYLQQQGLSIEEVAFLLGFSDTTAFHRAFRRWRGETPAQYRRGLDT